jgi:tetratricopeptide (TPR) repeat protein
MSKANTKAPHSAYFFVFYLLFIILPCFAQQAEPRPWWYTQERGKEYFRQGEYGKALVAFEDARNERRNMYAKMAQSLIDVLSVPEVRRMNNDLNMVEMYIDKQELLSARAALRELYYRVPRETLNNSAQAALDAITHYKDYPEADYWIGEVYRVEGEYGIALKEYQSAYDHRDLLETPGFDTEILYKMAEVYRIKQEYNDMEKSLNAVLAKDKLWSSSWDSIKKELKTNSDRGNTLSAMMRLLDKFGVNRFLTLFRYADERYEKAHRLLGLYDLASGRYDMASYHLAFSFLIQCTVMLNDIIKDQFDYAFTTLPAMVEATARRPELRTYMAQSEFYKTVYYFAISLYGSGKNGPATELWTFLAGTQDAGQWAQKAAAQLRNPTLERAYPMP